MLKASYSKYVFNFIKPGGTSRGILYNKTSWFIKIFDDNKPSEFGIGECSLLPGLSPDDKPELTTKIANTCSAINHGTEVKQIEFQKYPALEFAIETALIDLKNGGNRILFNSEFTKNINGIPINGLIWMGNTDSMKSQIKEKLDIGFRCLKLKIGALNFEEELNILNDIRTEYSPNELEIRLDANGAFEENNAIQKLQKLAKYNIHSIEQPINAGQISSMAQICKNSPIAIALDEELISIYGSKNKQILLETIKPAYIILKPSLVGGFKKAQQWINMAEKLEIKWWVTSALESNIGLNAIAQWTYNLRNPLPQGLGTGQVFSNNIPSPLIIKNAKLYYNNELSWNLNNL